MALVILNTLLLILFGGWYAFLGVLLIAPQALLIVMSFSILRRPIGKPTLVATLILGSYVALFPLLFLRALIDGPYSYFIFFGIRPDKGSPLDTFLTNIEPIAWQLLLVTIITLIVIAIVTRIKYRRVSGSAV